MLLSVLVIVGAVVVGARRCESGAEHRETTKAPAAPGTDPPEARRGAEMTSARGSIAGTVHDAAAAPISAARVCILPASLVPASGELPCTTTDPRGEFRFARLDAAEYVVTASAADRGPGATSFWLRANEARTGVDILLGTEGAELRGTVLDISGGPVARARITSLQLADFDLAGAPGPVVESNDSGEFSLWVTPGRVRVTAFADGYAAEPVLAGAPGTIEIALTPESSIAGTIVDAAGDPVAGARVRATSLEGARAREGAVLSTERGSFLIGGLAPGRYHVVATRPGARGQAASSTLVGLAQHVAGVSVTLRAAPRVTGVVRSRDDGRPCANASVVLHDARTDTQISMRRADDGLMISDGTPAGDYTPIVWCPGHRSLTASPIRVAASDPAPQVWPVEAGSAISGRVIYRDGSPASAAMVHVTSINPAGPRLVSADRASARGRFEITGLEAGAYTIEARSGTAVSRTAVSITVPATGMIEQDLVVERAGEIRGTLVDPSGVPVENVAVDAWPDTAITRLHELSAVTDARGEFLIAGLRAGTFVVTPRRGGIELIAGPDQRPASAQVTVELGRTAIVRLVVGRPSGEIRGVVVDAQGRPAGDVFVTASLEAGGSSGRVLSEQDGGDRDRPVLSRTDGRFVLERLPPGEYTIRAARRGGGEAIATHVAVGSQVRLAMGRTGTIRGVVRGAAGPPAQRLRLHLGDPRTGYQRFEIADASDGSFEIGDVPAGHYVLTAIDADGAGRVEIDLAEAEIEQGIVVVRLAYATVSGRVIDGTTGRPVAGVSMFVRFAFPDDRITPAPDVPAITGDDGRFTVTRVPQGAVVIAGMSSDDRFVEVERTIRGATLELGDLSLGGE